MAKISEADKAAIKEKIDMVTYLEKRGHNLTPSGASSFKMLCPVHNERTPSFQVNEEYKSFRCWGCGISGDIIELVKVLDNLEFVAAVQELAAEAGIQLSETEDDPQALKRIRLKKMMKEVAAWYRQNFIQLPNNHPGKENFTGRNLLDQAMKDELVGWAPSGGLQNMLTQKGFNHQDMMDAGLVHQNEDGTYRDRFRSRVTWALNDVQGNTLGFSARKILEQDNGPRYLNSPQTILYNKSRILLGLSSAKKTILTEQAVYIVEGQTDVMAMNAAGYSNVVASCGTAFGDQHSNVLMQLSQRGQGSERFKLIFCFDGDAAGLKAAKSVFKSNLDILIHMSVVKFITPEGQATDPCDYRKDYGEEKLQKLVNETAVSIVEFIIRENLKTWNVKTPEGQAQFISSSMNILKTVSDPVQHNAYVRMVAGWSGVPVSELKNLMKVRTYNNYSQPNAQAPTAHIVVPEYEDEMTEDDYASAMAEAAFNGEEMPEQAFETAPKKAYDPIELKMLSIIVQYPDDTLALFKEEGISLAFFPSTKELTTEVMQAIAEGTMHQLVDKNKTVASFIFLDQNLGQGEELVKSLKLIITNFMRHIHAQKIEELNSEMMVAFVDNSDSTDLMESFLQRQEDINKKFLPKSKQKTEPKNNSNI